MLCVIALLHANDGYSTPDVELSVVHWFTVWL